MIYTNDKKVRITLRLNEEQFTYVKKSSDAFGVSPSEFLRMVINMTMVMDKDATQKKMEEELEQIAVDAVEKFDKEDFRRGNDKADIDNLV